MASRGLILSLRGLSIVSQRNSSTSLRGFSIIGSDNARIPPLPLTTAPIVNSSAEEAKALELNLTARLSSHPLSNIIIKTPGFSNSKIIIGKITDSSTVAILDPAVKVSLIGDVIPSSTRDIVGDNPNEMRRLPEYKARHIQKIRRWKMNRHKLVKWRKKNKTKLLKRSYFKTKRKVKRSNAICKAIREDGENFDALEFVKKRLALAKTGGFVQDIWREPDDQPKVPWIPYKTIMTKVRKYEVKIPLPKFPTQKQVRAERKARLKKRQQS